MKTFFNRVAAWNSRAGVKTPPKFEFPSKEDRALMTDLMMEEAEEMHDATTKEELLDALADQQFVLLGNIARYGITWEEFQGYLRKVISSNESKFANTLQQAEDSIEKESERLGIPKECITFDEVDGKYVIRNADTGKILKSVLYQEPSEM